MTIQVKEKRLWASRHHIDGFSLIEIMVSMAIGLFLVLGATTLYVNTRKTADIDDSVARLQETARYAMSVIETDVRMANFWGLAKDGSSFDNTIANETAASDSKNIDAILGGTSAARACGSTFAFDIAKYLQGSNNSYTLNCAANSVAVATADTLTIRRAASPTNTEDDTKLQVCTSRGNSYMMVGTSLTCAVATNVREIHDLIVNTYYVDKQSDQSTTYPSLRLKSLIAGPAFTDVEVVPGVEDMQIQFGWAPASSPGVPSSGALMYLQPDNAALSTLTNPGSQIVAVRIWLLIRSESPDKSFTDTRTYSYAARTGTTGTNDLNDTTKATQSYKPNDNYRRILVSRTFFVRNVVAT